MQASKKFIMRRLCQNVWVSTRIRGPAGADKTAALALWGTFVCSPATPSAVAPHISHVL
jgi:hypothetical protein